MPLLATLLKTALVNLYLLVVAFRTLYYSTRISIAIAMAAIYIACVVSWSAFVAPLAAALFSTSYGALLGLLFPPLAGTVLTGYVALWGCMVAKNYMTKMVKIGIGG